MSDSFVMLTIRYPHLYRLNLHPTDTLNSGHWTILSSSNTENSDSETRTGNLWETRLSELISILESIYLMTHVKFTFGTRV